MVIEALLNIDSATQPLQGQVAIITGGSRGIGQACAELFAQSGANVITASRSESPYRLDEKYKDVIRHVEADIANDNDVSRLFNYCKQTFGPATILINNAAIITYMPFHEIPMHEWDQVMATNVRGAVLCSKMAFDHMAAHQKGGSIINISSLAGIPHTQKFAGYSPYTVSKFALCGLTEALAAEGYSKGIRVNAIAPGAVETSMLEKASTQLSSSTKPIDIAKIVLFLADNNQSRIISGSVIPVFCNEYI